MSDPIKLNLEQQFSITKKSLEIKEYTREKLTIEAREIYKKTFEIVSMLKYTLEGFQLDSQPKLTIQAEFDLVKFDNTSKEMSRSELEAFYIGAFKMYQLQKAFYESQGIYVNI
jgi:hypothetical protein